MTKDLAVKQEFRIAKMNPERVAKLIRASFGPDGINPVTDLQQVHIPAGGSTAWTVPTIRGEETQREIIGSIVHHHTARNYWPESIDQSGGGTPPSCSSMDGVTGVGRPGGYCAKCRFAQFGSAGRGQACKQMTWLYVLPPEATVPLLVRISATGIKTVRQYILGLVGAGMAPYEALTSIGLERSKNADGIAYSKPTLRFVDEITGPLRDTLEGYAESFASQLAARTPSLGNGNGGDAGADDLIITEDLDKLDFDPEGDDDIDDPPVPEGLTK